MVHQVIQPLVEHTVPLPALVEFISVNSPKTPKFRVTMIATQSHGFGQLAIQVDPYSDVRIGNSLSLLDEKVRQRKRNRVPASLEDLEVQVTVTRNPGSVVAVETIEVRYELLQPKIVTFIQRHQADKAPGPCNRLWYQ